MTPFIILGNYLIGFLPSTLRPFPPLCLRLVLRRPNLPPLSLLLILLNLPLNLPQTSPAYSGRGGYLPDAASGGWDDWVCGGCRKLERDA
jgi:hypothetical protein